VIAACIFALALVLLGPFIVIWAALELAANAGKDV